ncbi:MAG: hypothetical protein ABEK50_04215 [bacterium]
MSDVIVRTAWIMNLLSTWFMVGLIWFVQVVHYPLHGIVPEDNYEHYQKNHMVRTTSVVALPMIAEALTAGFLAYHPPGFGSGRLWIAGFLLVLVNLFSTYFLQRPAHERLNQGYSESTHQFLLRSNWIRTVAWTARGVLWVWFLVLLVN